MCQFSFFAWPLCDCDLLPHSCSTTVAASDEKDNFWAANAHSGSNFGRCVDIIAPVSVATGGISVGVRITQKQLL